MDFDELVDSYQKPIYNLIYRLLSDREEAADLTQETFVAAFRSWDTFRGESTAYTWLYRIAVNLCKNKFRERQRRRDYEAQWVDDGMSFDLPRRDGSAPEDLLQRKELKQAIERAISRLPDDYRIVAVLRDLQGLSYSEVAAAADLSVDVVRTRLARARAMIRKKLEPYLEQT